MDMRKPMTKAEKRLFKEAVIREYKLKYQARMKKQSLSNQFMKKMKSIMPLSIAIGLIACVLLLYLQGVEVVITLFLSGIIWITVISTLVSAFFKV